MLKEGSRPPRHACEPRKGGDRRFVTLAPATRDKILTIEELFDGRAMKIPLGFVEGFWKPAKEKEGLRKSLF
jgi:hypothetical protein